MVDLRQNAEARSILERRHVDAAMDLLHRLLVPEGRVSPATTEAMAAASAL